MQSIDPDIKQTFLSEIFRPAIVYWNRLEGRPRKEEIDRTLKAEVRDPLWMLCRQWQVGEFKAEDAGTAVSAKTQISTTRLNRFAPRGGESIPYDENTPLEATVESEPIQIQTALPNPADISLRIEIGLHWFKLLKQFTSEDVRAAYLDEFGFDDPGEISSPTDDQQLALAYLRSDQKGWQAFEAAKNRTVDGYKLLQAIADGTHQSWLDSHTEIPDTEKPKISDAADALMQWFRRVYFQLEAGAPASWAPSYLEYQFLNAAPADGEQKFVLEAEEYHGGRLDWYAYDIQPDASSLPADTDGAEIDEDQFVLEAPLSFIPTQIEFSGMPNVRWWAFEDRHTEFGQLKTSTTDIAQLMLAEFGLIYGNDWTVIPYNLKSGSLAEVQGIVVTDVFGVRTFIRPAGSGADDDWQRWSVYNLSTIGDTGAADTRLFLAPAIGKLQESKPIERVVLARDEVANMVWGVEETIAGVLGTGTNGFEAATALETFFQENQPPGEPSPLEENEAKIRYLLGTSVLENWIPFIPVRTEGSDREIQLQRAAMPRLSDLIPDSIVEPRTQLLRPGLEVDPKQPYHIHEQEILRAGIVLTRGFQRTRWFDGRVFTWIGRRKQTGLGEGASGLVFDQIVPKE